MDMGWHILMSPKGGAVDNVNGEARPRGYNWGACLLIEGSKKRFCFLKRLLPATSLGNIC